MKDLYDIQDMFDDEDFEIKQKLKRAKVKTKASVINGIKGMIKEDPKVNQYISDFCEVTKKFFEDLSMLELDNLSMYIICRQLESEIVEVSDDE